MSSSLLSSAVSDSSMKSNADKELAGRVVLKPWWVRLLFTVEPKLSCCFSNTKLLFPKKTEAVENKIQNTHSNSFDLNTWLNLISLIKNFIIRRKSNKTILIATILQEILFYDGVFGSFQKILQEIIILPSY